jgi:hypothetical protein
VHCCLPQLPDGNLTMFDRAADRIFITRLRQPLGLAVNNDALAQAGLRRRLTSERGFIAGLKVGSSHFLRVCWLGSRYARGWCDLASTCRCRVRGFQ